MATSKCGQCNNTRFEVVAPSAVSNAGGKMLRFVQCAGCGAVVGVLPQISDELRQDQAVAKIIGS